jgi:hypothetical protein
MPLSHVLTTPDPSYLISTVGRRSFIVSETTGSRIAEVYRSASAEESQATARLLAAAPELRNILEAVVQALSAFPNESSAQLDFRLTILEDALADARVILDDLGSDPKMLLKEYEEFESELDAEEELEEEDDLDFDLDIGLEEAESEDLQQIVEYCPPISRLSDRIFPYDFLRSFDDEGIN